ncbi:hypothetical protein IL306_015277 [Fusarium sp. DS 682]|nr:hypothetical protein IL306_015277 [Fusarium sp. DS 682]
MDVPPGPLGTSPTTKKDEYLWDYVFPLLHDPTPAVSGVSPNCSTSCGNLLLPMDSNRHTSSSRIKVEDWDMIKNAMQAAAKTEVSDQTQINLTEFGDLYTGTVSYDSSGNAVHVYELETPEMIIRCSDEYQTWLKRPNPNDDTPFPQDGLHFTQSLGMPDSFCLVKLFKTFQTSLAPGSESLTGFAFLYDAEADGNRGAALSIAGQSQPQVVSDPLNPSSGTEIPEPPSPPSPTIPGPLAAFLGQQSDNALNLDSIINLSYDNAKANADVQSTIIQVMQWHMQPEVSQLFFGTEEKPNSLDPSLTINMPSEIVNWLRTQYVPAYICRMLANNNSNIGTQFRFTSKEINRINYWWTGKGSCTLSASSEYKFLDRAVQRLVTLKSYPALAKLYQTGTSRHYSDLLYQKITTCPRLFAGLQNRDIQTQGTSQLTKICCIMDALDQGHTSTKTISTPTTGKSTTPAGAQATQSSGFPTLSQPLQITDTNSNLLAVRVLAGVRKDAWSQQFWGVAQMTDDKVKIAEQQWLSDCLQELLTMIVTKDPSLSGLITNNFYTEIQNYSDNNASWNELNTDAKVQQLFLSFSKPLTDFMGFLCMASKKAEDNTDQIYQYMRGMASVLAAATAVASSTTVDTVGETACSEAFAKPVWVILGTVALLCAASNLKGQWSATSSAERVCMITNVVASFNQITQLGTSAWEAFIQDGSGGPYSNMIQLMLARQLDGYISQILNTGARIQDGSSGVDAANTAGFDGISFDIWTNLLEEVQGLSTTTSQTSSTRYGDSPPPANQNLSLTNLLNNPQRVVSWRQGFNIANPALSLAEDAISTALVIFMTWQLTKNGASISERRKASSTVQLALASICDVFSVGKCLGSVASLGLNEAAFGYGSAVVACRTAFTAVDPVLAGLGVVPNIIPFFWSTISPTPPVSVDMWLTDKGKPWAESFMTPHCPIDISVSPASVVCSQTTTQAIKITITNTSPTAVLSQDLNFQFTTGPDDGTLFYTEYTITSATSATAVAVTLQTSGSNASMVIQNQAYPTTSSATLTRTSISIQGPSETDPASVGGYSCLTLAAGDTITLELNGTMWCGDGSDASIGYTQAWNDDSWNGILTISRTKS